MTETQLELTRILGKKELTFGCYVMDMWGIEYRIHQPGQLKGKDEIIGHPATLSDFHRWLNENVFDWGQNKGGINVKTFDGFTLIHIGYESSLDFLDQSEETLAAILKLVKPHESL